MQKEGIDGLILAADAERYAPALYKADARFIVPPVSDSRYIEALLDICSEHDASAVIPLIDTELELLAANKGRFEERGIKLIVSEERTVCISADKYLTYGFFKDNGFATPETFLPEQYKGELEFPVFLKPRFGSASIDTFKANDQDEFNVFIKRIKEPVIQQFVRGQEYTVDVFCDFSSRPLYITPRRRIAVRGGEVSKAKVEKNEDLINIVGSIVSKLDVCGPLTVQCMYSEGEYVFTEINARFGGGSPISIRAGADSPAALYRLLAGKEAMPNIYGFKDGMVALRYDQAVYLDK